MVKLATILCVVLMLSGAALADPWPAYDAHTDLASYISVSTTHVGDLWSYYVTATQPDPQLSWGPLDGIKALAVYPEAGDSVGSIDGQYNGYGAIRTNWAINGGWEGFAFGFKTGAPVDYIKPGTGEQFVGQWTYPTGYATDQDAQSYLVHLSFGNGAYTGWFRPGDDWPPIEDPRDVPEASSLMLGALGMMGPAGLLLRRRR